MKKPTIPQVRFTCRLVRGCISVFGDTTAGAPRGPGASHVAACMDCQQFFGACDELELALKRDAARQAQDAPAGLEQRIVRAVKLSTPEPRSRVVRPFSFALAGVAACAALTVLVLQRQSPAPRPAAPTNPVIAAGDVWTLLRPSADALLSGDPLQREADAVVSDARSAVRFLELNFLPTPPEAPINSG